MTHMSKQGSGEKQMKHAKLIIWDEAPIEKRRTIETIDRSFCDIMDKDAPFGRKVVVFRGDFR